MYSIQINHVDELIGISFDRAISKLDRIIYKVLNPNIPCEVCNRMWDTISPCAICNAAGRNHG